MKRIGLGFTGIHDEFNTYLESAQRAEELGYESFWVSEDYFLRDTMTLASPIAAQTEELDIGVFANPYTRNPALTAMSVASLGEIAGGTVCLGIGAGPPPVMEQIVDYESPLWSVKEGIDIIRLLLQQGEVTHTGDQFEIEDVILGKCPYMPYLGSYSPPENEVPIYVAAVGQQMLKMAGDVGDGLFISVGFPPALAEQAVERVQVGLNMRDRDNESYDVAGLAIATERITDRARQFAALTVGTVHDTDDLLAAGLDENDVRNVRNTFEEGGLPPAADIIPDEMVEAFVVTETNHEQWLDDFANAGVDIPILLHLGPGDPGPIIEMGAAWAEKTE